MVGASDRALRPACLRFSGEVSPLVAASRIFEATWARAPVSCRETLSQTSSRTARKSAVVAESNMGAPHRKSYFRAIAPVPNSRVLKTSKELEALLYLDLEPDGSGGGTPPPLAEIHPLRNGAVPRASSTPPAKWDLRDQNVDPCSDFGRAIYIVDYLGVDPWPPRIDPLSCQASKRSPG